MSVTGSKVKEWDSPKNIGNLADTKPAGTLPCGRGAGYDRLKEEG